MKQVKLQLEVIDDNLTTKSSISIEEPNTETLIEAFCGLLIANGYTHEDVWHSALSRAKSELRLKDLPIREILDDLAELHPYKVSGKPETYVPYNEGWQDALDIAEQELLKS